MLLFVAPLNSIVVTGIQVLKPTYFQRSDEKSMASAFLLGRIHALAGITIQCPIKPREKKTLRGFSGHDPFGLRH